MSKTKTYRKRVLLHKETPKEDLEVISLDEISEDEYDEFTEGIERS